MKVRGGELRTEKRKGPKPERAAQGGDEVSTSGLGNCRTDPERRAGGRTCAPRPPRLSQAPAGPTAWSRRFPQPPRPSPPPRDPHRSRRGPVAARGDVPHRARCVDAPGSRRLHFRFRSKMAAAVAASALPVAFGRLVSACGRSILRPSGPGAGEARAAGEGRKWGKRCFPPPRHVCMCVSDLMPSVLVAFFDNTGFGVGETEVQILVP